MQKLNYFIDNIYKDFEINDVENALKELNISNIEYLHRDYYSKNKPIISNPSCNNDEMIDYNYLNHININSQVNNKNLILFTDLFVELFQTEFTNKLTLLKSILTLIFIKKKKS